MNRDADLGAGRREAGRGCASDGTGPPRRGDGRSCLPPVRTRPSLCWPSLGTWPRAWTTRCWPCATRSGTPSPSSLPAASTGRSLSSAARSQPPCSWCCRKPCRPQPGIPPLSVAAPAFFGTRAAALQLALPAGVPRSFDVSEPGLAHFPPEPAHFVRRGGPMTRATIAMAPESGKTAVLFHGMAEAGKTACALELAYRYASGRSTGNSGGDPCPLAGGGRPPGPRVAESRGAASGRESRRA